WWDSRGFTGCLEYAMNEPFIIVIPEKIKERGCVYAFLQWSKIEGGQEKINDTIVTSFTVQNAKRILLAEMKNSSNESSGLSKLD
ncbi:9752_t:CDS:2, partial [Dentiscutata heterogama]